MNCVYEKQIRTDENCVHKKKQMRTDENCVHEKKQMRTVCMSGGFLGLPPFDG